MKIDSTVNVLHDGKFLLRKAHYHLPGLSRVDGYLQNRRLHLVAAPGSGKTVLGLEVIKRVNQPTLVLAPTITIRDQWVDRLVDLFLSPGSGRPSWVSTELRNPAFLTIATYQALHAVCSNEPEEQTQPNEAEENGDVKSHVFEPLSNSADSMLPLAAIVTFKRTTPPI